MGFRQIYCDVDQVWDMFEEQGIELGDDEFIKLAEWENEEVEVHMLNSSGILLFEVYEEGDLVREDFVLSKEDAECTLREIYEEFFAMEYDSEDEEEEGYLFSEEENEEIAAREASLTDAVFNFLEEVCPEESAELFNMEEIEDIKDHFLEYLARKYSMDIYRPMVLEDENGEEFYTDYPYDCMEYEDEGNPVYAR